MTEEIRICLSASSLCFNCFSSPHATWHHTYKRIRAPACSENASLAPRVKPWGHCFV